MAWLEARLGLTGFFARRGVCPVDLLAMRAEAVCLSKELFNLIDTDRSGFIDQDELQTSVPWIMLFGALRFHEVSVRSFGINRVQVLRERILVLVLTDLRCSHRAKIPQR